MTWNPNDHPRGPDGKFESKGGPLRGTQRRVSVDRNSDENAGFTDEEHARGLAEAKRRYRRYVDVGARALNAALTARDIRRAAR